MTDKKQHGGRRSPPGGRPANPDPTHIIKIVCSDEDKERIVAHTNPTTRAAILLAAIKAADAANAPPHTKEPP